MVKLIISGCNGRMGQAVSAACRSDEDITVVAGFDINAVKLSDFPVYSDPMEFGGSADVVLDFSNPAALGGLLSYCVARSLPVVLCTTGYSDAQTAQIQKASEHIPVFKSANMTIGINLLMGLVKKAAEAIGADFDIEIVERHHNKKVDAPSGTALMLADAAAQGLESSPEFVFERASKRKARSKNEIGISAVRGGTIPGEHEVIFAGSNEVIELKHIVYSREVFAAGGIRAAKFLATRKKPGMYNMNDALFGE
jgi:4-hydroxy-tetrahydrodipicolinate reductase